MGKSLFLANFANGTESIRPIKKRRNKEPFDVIAGHVCFFGFFY